jgi:ribosome-associated protein
MKAAKTVKQDKLLKAAVEALEEIKGRDIVVMDVRKMTALFDHVIVVSGESTRQNKALANSVQVKLKALGANLIGVEGVDPGEWILVDLGQIVVHVMQPAVRQHYKLEELWGGTLPALRAAGLSAAV